MGICSSKPGVKPPSRRPVQVGGALVPTGRTAEERGLFPVVTELSSKNHGGTSGSTPLITTTIAQNLQQAMRVPDTDNVIVGEAANVVGKKPTAQNVQSLGLSDTGNKVFEITDDDVIYSAHEHDWEISRNQTGTNQSNERQTTVGATIPVGSPITVTAQYANTRTKTHEVMRESIIIRMNRVMYCSLNRTSLALRKGIREEDFGNYYVSNGALRLWCEVCIIGNLDNCNISKQPGVELSARLFFEWLKPCITRKSTSGNEQHNNSVTVTIKSNFMALSNCNLRTDSISNLETDIKQLLWDPIQQAMQFDHGNFEAVGYKEFPLTRIRRQCRGLLNIIDEINTNLRLPQVSTNPGDRCEWLTSMERDIKGILSNDLSNVQFYRSDTAKQSNIEENADNKVRNITQQLMNRIYQIGQFVSTGDKYEVRLIGYNNLYLTADFGINRLVCGRNNSASLSVMECKDVTLKNSRLTGYTQFYLITDDGFYLSNNLDNTIGLVEHPVTSCVWYLKRDNSKDVNSTTSYYLHNAATELALQKPSQHADQLETFEQARMGDVTDVARIAQLQFSVLSLSRWQDALHGFIGNNISVQAAPASSMPPENVAMDILEPFNFLRKVFPGLYEGIGRVAVLVVGITGTGKSTFINQALGHKFESKVQVFPCEVTRLSRLPDTLDKYKGSYILVNSSLHYINSSGRSIKCEIDTQQLSAYIGTRSGEGVLLSVAKIEELILSKLPEPSRRPFKQEGLSVKNSSKPFAGMAMSAGSGTIYPMCYTTPSLVLIDAPGLKDTDHRKRSTQAFSMFLAKEMVTKLKVIVTLKYEDFDRGNVLGLLATLEELSEVFSSFEEAAGRITFLINMKGATISDGTTDIATELDYKCTEVVANCLAQFERAVKPYKEFLQFCEAQSTTSDTQMNPAAPRRGWSWRGVIQAVTNLALGNDSDDSQSITEKMNYEQKAQKKQFIALPEDIQNELKRKWNAIHFLKLMTLDGLDKNVFEWGYDTVRRNRELSQYAFYMRLLNDNQTELPKGLLNFEQSSGDVNRFISKMGQMVTQHSNQLGRIITEIKSIEARLNLGQQALIDNTQELHDCLRELAMWDSEVLLGEVQLKGTDADVAVYNIPAWYPKSGVCERADTDPRFTRVVEIPDSGFIQVKNSATSGGELQMTTALSTVVTTDDDKYISYSSYAAQYQSASWVSPLAAIPTKRAIGYYYGRKKEQNPQDSQVAIRQSQNRVKNAKMYASKAWRNLFNNAEGFNLFLQELEEIVCSQQQRFQSLQASNTKIKFLNLLLKSLKDAAIKTKLLTSSEVAVPGAVDTDAIDADTIIANIKTIINKLTDKQQNNPEQPQTPQVKALTQSLEKYKSELAKLKDHFYDAYCRYCPLLYIFKEAQMRTNYLKDTTILYDLEKFIETCEQVFGFNRNNYPRL